MEIDYEKIDKTVLALLQLTLHGDDRAWKGMDFDVMNRLNESGYILNPVGKQKSVVFTEKGLSASSQLFTELFTKE